MDNELKKELKNLEHDYYYEETIRIANLRKSSSQIRNETKTVKFTENDKLSMNFSDEKQPPPLIRGILDRIRNCSEPKLATTKLVLTDWLFLAILGIVIGLLSTFVDEIVKYSYSVQLSTLTIAEGWNNPNTLAWFISLSAYLGTIVGLILASACCVHYISPQAIGSGVPEMKTIMRGVVLKDYLTVRTLISKVIGISLSLSSGVPIGKMGPFVHISSVVSNQMSKIAGWIEPTFNNEQRRTECLAAACAVGVACTFSAPVGGVLFSIEITTMYFSVRSYWRGFFAACCGATTIRLLRGYMSATDDEHLNVNAFQQTDFPAHAFTVHELPAFAILGLLCGLLGTNYYAKRIFQRNWYFYPFVISLIYGVLTFRYGLGQFTTGKVKFGMNLKDFFSNCTFTAPLNSPKHCQGLTDDNWYGQPDHVLCLLTIFICVNSVFSLLCMSLPIPSGVFGPVFTLGAALGRLYGEIVFLSIPRGIMSEIQFYPGVYAVVGSASFSASVTHSVSVSMMILEITGQLHLILPVMISVVISNAVCAFIQPSFFDIIIKIKHLPFLPDIPPNSHIVHSTFAQEIMTPKVVSVTRQIKYSEIKRLLLEYRGFRVFPVIDSSQNQIMIGTVSRRFLLEVIKTHVGDTARKLEAERRVRQAIQTIDQHFTNTKSEINKKPPPRTRSAVSLNSKCSSIIPRTHSLGDQLRIERKLNRFLVVPIITQDELGQSAAVESSDADSDFIHMSPASPETASSVRRNSSSRRNAFCSLEHEKNVISNDDYDDSHSVTSRVANSTIHAIGNNYQNVVKNYFKQAKKYISNMHIGQMRKDDRMTFLYDLQDDERREWEAERLDEEFIFDEDDIDQAPFQLVKRTSVYKIHSMFSMLQLSKAYVTDCGRLIGVVALSDLRRELEKTQLGTETKKEEDNKPNLQAEVEPSVYDILTPTLEIVRPNIESSEVLNERDLERCDPSSRLRKSSSLRVPHVCRHENLGKRRESSSLKSGNLMNGENLVQAVAYLRRKSSVLDRRMSMK